MSSTYPHPLTEAEHTHAVPGAHVSPLPMVGKATPKIAPKAPLLPHWRKAWQETAPSPVPGLGTQLAAIQRLYTFRGPVQVDEFLETHPALIPLLFEAYGHIEEHFGQRPLVSLQVVADPEATDSHELYAFIGTRLSAEEALDRLSQIDDEWWLDVLDKAQGNLCIDVEFL